MLGFFIMMLFVTFILFVTSVSLLRGNTSFIHGKVYEVISDKMKYGKAIGKLTLVMSILIAISGFSALFASNKAGIRVAVVVLVIVLIIAAFGFNKIQKRYRN